jgi:branched-chain amino acid transport system substrate-binding protein
MSSHLVLARRARRRSMFAAAAVAALALAPSAFAQSKGEIRNAHVYSKTGPLEA